ncbi:MAG: glycosyltransferase family 2 protein [Proteobacteria bacterium]|nr:glycosyltransferase family 2 protein [Pseudomonadota bacterium]
MAMSNEHPAPRPLVAIVTPVFNGEKHLEDAIRAVQAQTYRPLVHCILDNASSDGTPAIIARYAGGRVPIIAGRNPETISFQRNFNAVLELMPEETAYFRMLHADDGMPPNAIEDMMKIAVSAHDIVLVAGGERMNGKDRPHFFPPECQVFEASNMLARTLVDEAHVPSAHVLWRRDTVREGEEFYPTDMVECIIAAVHRVLSRGGRAGFVHGHVADTLRYAGSGSLIDTFAPTVKAVLWEKLLFIERYGPAALSNREYEFVHRRFRRVFYRRLLWWAATGRTGMAMRDYRRMRERGLRPMPWDFVDAVAVWPAYLFAKRFSRPHAARPWPKDAVTSTD